MVIQPPRMIAVPAVFPSFDEAADWIDQYTDTSNAGGFLIEPQQGGYFVTLYRAYLDNNQPSGQ